MNPEMDPSVTNCENCHSPMPIGLRFCRNCGFRLGEGSAEYTETVRFQDVPAATLGQSSAAASGAPYFAGGPMAISPGAPIKKRRGRMSGMSWLFIGLVIFFIAAAVFTSVIKPIRDNVNVQIARKVPRSDAGLDDVETTAGGVTFANVQAPGAPADKAGLVGGDIITTIDGQPVPSDDDLTAILRSIPIGKTVEVVYIRDGETKNTQLTTISEEEMERLDEVFGNSRRAQFGYEDGEAERVPIAGTKMFGVQLGEILPNRPADIAGVKEGDIVIEFDDIPIRTTDEFLSRVRRAEPYGTIKLVVMRGQERLEIPVKMGKQ